MLVVGLTGGIGSGKSTVAHLFAERQVSIIDADVIARDLTRPGEAAYGQIIEHFGRNIILNNGALDRRKLRKIIFQHRDERLWLENLLHPLIRTAIKNEIKQISMHPTMPYCIVVIPLLFETLFPYDFLNRILVIDIPPALQVARTTKRDTIDADIVKTIIQTQVAREDRLIRADDVINNEGSIGELVPQVEKLHRLYLNLS